MSDRKAELERKKAKLQALREEKDRRRREKELKDMEEATGRAVGPGLLLDKDNRKDLDEMLSSLGVAPVSDVLSSLSSMSSLTPEHSRNHTPDASLQPGSSPATNTSISSAATTTPGRKREPQLCVVSIQTTNIVPKEVVTYTKQTQTMSSGHERDGYFEDWWRPRKAHATDYYDEYNLNPGLEWEDEFTVLTFDDPQAEDEEGSLPHLDGFQSKLPPGILPHGLPQVKEVQPAVTALEHESAAKQRREHEERTAREVRELSEEEKQMIMLSEEFRRFMDRTGRVVERALGEQVDVCADYTGGAGADGAEDGSDERSRAQRLSLNRCFGDERWSRNRCVTALDWSPQYPELLLASYHCNEEAPNEPDGVCLVWNSKFRKVTPEYVFHCQSAVTAAAFARFHPNLVVGGTYSGQIVLWDNRVQKRTPVQRTPLAATAHTHPVYCVCVVGTQNAHNLITVSTDGRMCSWSLDMLSQPQEKLELQRQQSKPVAATCLAFPRSDVNNFVVGSEEGAAYGACRHGARAGLTDTYEAHQGSVTAVSTNAVPGGIDFSHLFLTSSIDWTVKLWSVREPRPVHSFEHNADYVLDVAWSPTHPALFAAVDGSGRLDLWNLNQDTEVPAAGVLVDGAPALNRVAWAPSGLQVAAGDDAGRVWIYDVAETFAHPRHDDWNRLMYTIQELRGAQADEDLDHRLGLVAGGFGAPDQRLAASPLRCV